MRTANDLTFAHVLEQSIFMLESGCRPSIAHIQLSGALANSAYSKHPVLSDMKSLNMGNISAGKEELHEKKKKISADD